MTVQELKNRFGIIGNSPLLDHAIKTAMQVAPTEITVLISGESGVGKENFPQIIHHLSARKHGPYISINCGAIPEGTIDSELFGHEKGSFTGAHEARKGYFEVVNGGTIFLDEVADLPLPTQARLLRVLETGEFIKVGSSKVLKTNVRVVAATNVNIPEAIRSGRFREDLYYRLSTVPILIPALRERKEDIILLFRKFASDFAEKYQMPSVDLLPETQKILIDYRWPGNVRQLKNITEQISILEKEKRITPATLLKYLPKESMNTLPVIFKEETQGQHFSERELLYKVLFDMKKDIHDLKKIVVGIIQPGAGADNAQIFEGLLHNHEIQSANEGNRENAPVPNSQSPVPPIQQHEEIEEDLSLSQAEAVAIKKALDKHKGRKTKAAKELGISDRTLYRKMQEYKLE